MIALHLENSAPRLLHQEASFHPIVCKELDWAHCKRGGAVATGARGKNGRKETERSTEVGMIDDLKEGSYASVKRRVEDRERWRVWLPRTC